MSSASTRSPTSLFNDWKRHNNGDAGQQLAQRAADWYYAIATSFAGETAGAEVADKACAQFGGGVGRVTNDDELIPWAHSVLMAELKTIGNPAKGLNHPSLYSNARPPIDVLLYANRELPNEVKLLETCYNSSHSKTELQRATLQMGFFPYALADARNRVKKLIRDHLNAPLNVVYDELPRDLGPLPLYEGNRLRSANEREVFESWMLSSEELCQDIAEFAPFAIELRQGLPNREPPTSIVPVSSPVASVPGTEEREFEAPKPIVPDQSAAFMMERPLGRPAPERPGRRRFRSTPAEESSLRVRLTIFAIIFCLALALGLTLISS